MSWPDLRKAIAARFAAACPLGTTKRDWSSFGAPSSGAGAFAVPTIDSTTPANSVWVRLTDVPFARTSRAFSLGPDAPNYFEGQVIQQYFYPRGLGEAFIESTLEAARLVFHRVELAGGLQFRDTAPPERADSDDAQFEQVNVVTPYYVLQTAN